MLILFYFVVFMLYACTTLYLLYEYRHSSPQQRQELQTVPLLCASTFAYITLIFKTHQLLHLLSAV